MQCVLSFRNHVCSQYRYVESPCSLNLGGTGWPSLVLWKHHLLGFYRFIFDTIILCFVGQIIEKRGTEQVVVKETWSGRGGRLQYAVANNLSHYELGLFQVSIIFTDSVYHVVQLLCHFIVKSPLLRSFKFLMIFFSWLLIWRCSSSLVVIRVGSLRWLL